MYPGSSLLQRVQECILGQDIIEWASDNFEPFLSLFDVVRMDGENRSRIKDGAIYLNSLPDMARMHAHSPTSHVLFTYLNENWGGFSTTVPGRTIDWGHWDSVLADAGSSPAAVQNYLADPRVKAVVTPQHTAIQHPRILSLPIGVKHSQSLLDHLRNADDLKTQELLLNNSGWRHRQQINAGVIANFDGRLYNTYGATQTEYYRSILRSRFVLCPSGLGWDSYRIWETLVLGSVPIIERSPGWDSVLDDLPVLKVTDFSEVTPGLLARAWPSILAQRDRFDFGKLTKQWWVSRIHGLLDKG